MSRQSVLWAPWFFLVSACFNFVQADSSDLWASITWWHIICYADIALQVCSDTGGMGNPITLVGLNVLQTLIICCDHQVIQCSITVMLMWRSPCHSSPDSIFELWLHSELCSPYFPFCGFTLPFIITSSPLQIMVCTLSTNFSCSACEGTVGTLSILSFICLHQVLWRACSVMHLLAFMGWSVI